VAAFEAGLHVLCEKPLARTVAECDAILAARDRAGRLLQVGMHRRYNRLFQRLRCLVDAGELGDLAMMWTQEFRGDWKKLAGVFAEHEAFARCLRQDRRPLASGEVARAAVDVETVAWEY
jgi:hypothetical protein